MKENEQNQSMETTKAWYDERGMQEEYCKLYVCKTCKYEYACMGIKTELRINCKEYIFKLPRKKQNNYTGSPAILPSVKQMLADERTMQQRLRDGE